MITEFSRAAGQLSVSPARHDDLEPIMELERASFGVEQWSERSWSSELVADGRTVLLARAHRLLGVISMHHNDREAELMRLAVAPNARRRGIGAVLVRAGVEAVAHAGARSVILEVRWDNEAAIALYQRLGFEQLAARDNYYAPGVHALIMKLWDVADLGRGWRPDWTEQDQVEQDQVERDQEEENR